MDVINLNQNKIILVDTDKNESNTIDDGCYWVEIQITNGYTNSCNSLIDKINQQSKCKLDAIKHIERAIMLLESDIAPFHALNSAINVLK